MEKEMEKGERIFLKDSKEIYSSKDIGDLAKEMETKFNTKAIISLEFEDLTQNNSKKQDFLKQNYCQFPHNRYRLENKVISECQSWMDSINILKN